MASQHEISLNTPVLYVKCEEAFAGLSNHEKKYIHHLARASWWGNFIIMCQRSLESPVIFSLLIRLFKSQPLDTLKAIAISEAGFTEDEFQDLLNYYSVFLCNSGNYLGYGDSKFVLHLHKEKLKKLLLSSKAYIESSQKMDYLMSQCLDMMYSLEKTNKFLGMPSHGVTCYFTPNCTTEDANMIKEYMVSRNIEAWNTRLIKQENNGGTIYDIRIASVDKDAAPGITVYSDVFQGHKIRVSRGDFSYFLQQVVKELNKAKQYANSLEQKMIDKYIESFTTGSIQAHKNGSALWVQNKSPAVETYIGFIEVYADPTNQRAEFESFVAIVNREQSKKFNILVERAEKEFLPLLPWGSDFEDDCFRKPDFSAIDILAYATSYLPRGINIPDYKDVKEDVGCKNLIILNAMYPRIITKVGPFLSAEDQNLRSEYSAKALEIRVALHELLGHGCGKLLRRRDDGTLNFDPAKVKDPFTGYDVTYYEKGQTFQTEFTDVSSAYEECRADAVALYLGLEDSVLDIFGVPPDKRDDVKYVIWLDVLHEGLMKLETYQSSKKKWGEAHSQSRYVLLRLVLEAGEGLVNISEIAGSDGLPDLEMKLDRKMISSSGKSAIGEFLKKLQIYRSIADSKSGRAMFEKYSEVPEDGPFPFDKWYEIVVRKSLPTVYLTLPNTVIDGDTVTLLSYNDGAEECVSSWCERFSSADYTVIEEELLKIIENHSK